MPADVRKTIDVTAFGAFLVAQQAARMMIPEKRGTILLSGASAGVKGYAQSAPFAMGKFALRGLAQSMARELHPKGIHIGHVVIDGGIRSAARPDTGDTTLDPEAIAQSYLHIIDQPRSSGHGRSRCGRGARRSRSPERPFRVGVRSWTLAGLWTNKGDNQW